MAIKDKYYIKEIDSNTANSVVVKCHYAHRKASCLRAFGLFSKSPNKLVGVVIYGMPVNHVLCEELCGFKERSNIYELTRLYIDDGRERNLESFLVGNTLKLLDREIIISYADTEMNHIGIVYQATNFYYIGTSSPGHRDYEYFDPVEGIRLHNKTLFDKFGGADAIKSAMDMGMPITMKERSVKHRYVYFNCDKKRKKELLKKLKYPILPYPKQNCPVPNTSDVNIGDGRLGGLF